MFLLKYFIFLFNKCVKIYYVNSCRALECIMNKENASELWKIIQETDDYLRD